MNCQRSLIKATVIVASPVMLVLITVANKAGEVSHWTWQGGEVKAVDITHDAFSHGVNN